MRPAAYINRLNVHVLCVQVLHLVQCKCKPLGRCSVVGTYQMPCCSALADITPDSPNMLWFHQLSFAT